MSFDNWRQQVVSRLTFPFTSYLYNRRHINSNYRKLINSEHVPPDKARHRQLKRLKELVSYLYTFVPFYKNLFKKIGFEPGDLKQLEDLKGIPALSRAEVIDFHKKMVDMRRKESIPFADFRPGDPGTPIPFARFKKHNLVRNTSSGSTGAPTIFYEDGSRTALNWVHEMRLKHWYGVKPFDKEARMVRLSVDYDPQNRTIQMRKRLWNQFLIPGTNLGDPDYDVIVQELLSFRPKVLWGFPSALAGTAAYINRNHIDLGGYKPVVAIGWAGPVYEHEEDEIKRAFGCEVSNNYGAREVGHVAGRCPHGTFHINQENLFVETEARDEVDIKHEVGELLVTTLDITPMPFLRYRMGDIGKVDVSNCNCGRSLQELSGFIGRTGEIFITKDGRMISPNFWCRFFFTNNYSNAVRRFQVVYKKDKNIKIVIERDINFTDDTEESIRAGIKKNFSTETELRIEYIDKIKPEISGKYKMVINEANL